MAWLHATPKPREGSKRAKFEAEEASKGNPPVRISRLDALKKDGIEPRMPPNPAPHIIRWLVEIGITETTGTDSAVLSWREINAWCERTCIELSPWEARLIRSLSAEYLAQARKSDDENYPPPWIERRKEVSQQARDAEIARLQMVLG